MSNTQARHPSRQGTVLIASLSIIVVIAGLSLVMMKSSEQNIRSYQQEKREMQAKYVGESALSIGIHHLNDKMLTSSNAEPGDLADSPEVIHSADGHGYRPLVLAGTTERGHPDLDRFDNDDDGVIDEDGEDNPLVDPNMDDVTSDGDYLGGLYRVKIQEWVGADQDGNGTADVLENGDDDDDDGTTDEPDELFTGAKNLNDTGRDDDGDGDVTDSESGEVKFHTSASTRYFTLAVETTYANYTIVMRAFTNAVEVAADKYGVYSSGSLDIRGKSTVDSYDSAEGEYGTAPTYSNGNVGSEASMKINSNSVIKGDAKEWDGGSADGTPEVNGTVEGQAKTMEETQPTTNWYLSRDFASLSTDYTATSDQTISNANFANLTIDNNVTVTLQAGDSHVLGNFTSQDGTSPSSDPENGIFSDGTLKIGTQGTTQASKVYIQNDWKPDSNVEIYGPPNKSDEPTEVYVADDFVARKGSDVTTEGHVVIYVVDEMYYSSQGSITNNNTNTSMLTFEVGGTWEGTNTTSSSNGEVDFQPGSDFKGFINAPAADEVNIAPKGDFYGAVIGNNTTIQPGGDFHYDERISEICDNPNVSVACNWVVKSHNAWIVQRRGASIHNP